MPSYVRRHTIHTLAILSVLRGERRPWSTAEVAERCQLSYQSAYAVLRRLFETGRISRYENHGEAIGYTRITYKIEPPGIRVVDRIMRVDFRDPAKLMQAWIVEDVDQ